MSNAPVDHGRRRFLTIATSVVGGVGAIGALFPLLLPGIRVKKLNKLVLQSPLTLANSKTGS